MPQFSQMSEDLKNYFSFSKRERRGIIALIALIMIFFAIAYSVKFINSNEETDISGFEKEIDALISSTQKKDTTELTIKAEETTINASPIEPNTATEEQWRGIGISSNQYRVIKNYLRKGGKFKSKEDLKKIYSITPEVYKKIEPYIYINKKDSSPIVSIAPIPQNKTETKPAKSNLVIEINTADTTLLQALPGIGSSFASRIVKYRNLLGGFHKKEQLLEVYGMDEARYSGFQQNISIDPAFIKRIEINNATVTQLQQHPYIDKQLSYLIVSYRNQHGIYRSIEDFKKLALVNEEIVSRLLPYLSFD